MKKVFSFLLIVLSWQASARCQLRHDIVSLSAPVTGVLQEMGLLSDKHLKGISLFHPVAKSEYKGTRYSGGVFLAQKTLRGFKNQVVFFDESGELSRRLKNAGLRDIQDVRTRGLDPFETTERTLKVLDRHIKECETEVLRLKLWMASEKEELLKLKTFRHPLYFFLGRIKNQRLPELMMVSDGPVLFWKRNGKIKTFDSDLAYVRWGEKWRKSLPESDVMVGVIEVKPGEKFHLEKGEKRYWNVFDVGALTPGPAQIHFMHRFAKTWID